ncbi:MYCT protein, partial [Grus americana]|nr:MYCT protein [Grus americana]
MGEKRRQHADGSAGSGAAAAAAGERSLIAAESCSSLNSAASGGELERAARRQFQQDETPGFVYVVSVFSALGGFLFGYDTGVVGGFEALGCWPGQRIAMRSGEGSAGHRGGAWEGRECVLALLVLLTGGVVLARFRGELSGFCTGRMVSHPFCNSSLGWSVSVASMTVPVYIAEVAPPHLRGRLVTINTLFITGGQFFASVVDGIFSYLAKDGWRYMLGLSAVPAVIQFLGFLFLPESPRWLIQKGQTQRARRILSQMRGNQAIDEEYDSIKNNIEEEEKEVGAAGPVICRMLTYPPTRRALIVGCGLQMFQQLSGINTVMYYSATILQMSGVEDDRLAIWLAALTAFINFIFTLVGVWLVERMGRRKLTLGSLAGTAVALIILASGFLLSAQVSPRITLNPPDPSHQNSTCTKYSYCNGCMLDPDCGLCYKLNKSSVIESSCIPVNKDSTMKAAWGR